MKQIVFVPSSAAPQPGTFRAARAPATVGLLAILGLMASLVAVGPARADDDGGGSFLSSVVGTVVGFGKPTDTNPNIDYRERPPLVLPPKVELQQPVRPAAERNPAWPKDPDVMAARKAQALARAPATTVDATQKLSKEELMRGRIPGGQQEPSIACDTSSSRGCNGDATQMWQSLRTAKGEDTTLALQPGVEPEREYLTQPPKGYLAPKKVVKYTFDGPSKNIKEETQDAAEYTRQQASRRRTGDDE